MRRTVRPARLGFLALAAVLAVARPGSAGPLPLDATTRDFDQTHLVVRVTPHLEAGTVDGETTVRFVALTDPLRVLRLHCLDTTVLSVRDGAGAPCAFTLADGVLTVALKDPVRGGAEGEVTVVYTSAPRAGLYFHAPDKGCPDTPLEMYSQGQADDNRRWIPCYDQPDDRATVEVVATVPEGLKTVSGGTKVASEPAGPGLRRDTWRLDHRIPSYLITLIVGRYETVLDRAGDVPLEFNGPPGRADELRQGFSATKDVLAFFAAYTGRRYPYPAYTQTTVWDFVYGGMENASATTMNMRLLHPAEARPNYSPDVLVAHEAAHQWFGDIVTCRTWEHLWLNEGFATYFTDLFFEHRDGEAEFALVRFQQNRGYMDGTPRPDALGLVADPRGDVPLELFDGKQYNRGAAILHQLRLELGDDLFRACIRRYVKEHEDRAVVSDDLRRSCEAEAGRSLEWFFRQWVYGAGYPVLQATPSPGTTEGVWKVVVEQTQVPGGGQPEAFRLTVPWRVVVGSRRVDGAFDVRRRRQVFDVPVGTVPPGATVGFRLGAGGGTFARCRVMQGEAAWRLVLATDPDPTARIEAVEALGEWGANDDTFASLARAAATDPVHAVRSAAVRAVGGCGAPLAARAKEVLAAERDADPRVREAVAETLGTLTRDVAAAAAGRLVLDPNPYVRAAAATSLGRLHADGAFETLRDLLKVRSHREVVQKGALEGLTALGDLRALPYAVQMLPYNSCRGDHHTMRRAALDLLLALAPDAPETHAQVVALLDDGFHRMRGWAAEAAGKLRVRAAAARLRTMADRDPDGGAKAAAKAALERLAK